MERIKVTPEMRARILENLSDVGPAERNQPKLLRFPALRRWATLAACLALALVGALAVPRWLNPEGNPPVDIVFEVLEADSAEELSELVGFSIQEPEGLPFEAEETTYLAYGTELAEVTCTGGGETAVYRKGTGSEDVSGDYEEYAAVDTLSVGGVSATLKGNGEGYTLAVWSDESFSYSLSLSEDMSAAEWTELLRTLLAE